MASSIVLFCLSKKEPKKDTGKGYTPPLPEAAMCSFCATVNSTLVFQYLAGIGELLRFSYSHSNKFISNCVGASFGLVSPKAELHDAQHINAKKQKQRRNSYAPQRE